MENLRKSLPENPLEELWKSERIERELRVFLLCLPQREKEERENWSAENKRGKEGIQNMFKELISKEII